MQILKNLFQFIKDVANDERIPARDKKVIVGCLALIISPIDIIPDWIPIIGILDDILLLAIILDYFFEVLDQDILLSHYPYGMKSFTTIRRLTKTITWMTPKWAKSYIWKYEKSPYK